MIRYGITTFYGNLSVQSKSQILCTTSTSSKIVGCTLTPSFQEIFEHSHTQVQQAQKICSDAAHGLHTQNINCFPQVNVTESQSANSVTTEPANVASNLPWERIDRSTACHRSFMLYIMHMHVHESVLLLCMCVISSQSQLCMCMYIHVYMCVCMHMCTCTHACHALSLSRVCACVRVHACVRACVTFLLTCSSYKCIIVICSSTFLFLFS